jgi:hypothetical protein
MVYVGESPVAAFDLYDRFNVFFFSDWQDGAVLAYPLGYRQDQIRGQTLPQTAAQHFRDSTSPV